MVASLKIFYPPYHVANKLWHPIHIANIPGSKMQMILVSHWTQGLLGFRGGFGIYNPRNMGLLHLGVAPTFSPCFCCYQQPTDCAMRMQLSMTRKLLCALLSIHASFCPPKNLICPRKCIRLCLYQSFVWNRTSASTSTTSQGAKQSLQKCHAREGRIASDHAPVLMTAKPDE